MQEFFVTKGATSVILPVSIYDSSSTIGAKLPGLVYNTASLTAYYNRTGAAAATAITMVTATKGTWVSSGFVAIDGTNMPGDYELHIPDTALASGANTVLIQLKGAANMVPVNVKVHLMAFDLQTAVAQTGDNYARLGAPAGASVSADVAAVKVDTAAVLVDTGTTIDAAIAAVKVDTAATLVDTAQIGVAGAGLTDLGGMSTAMKAQVNTEADTALSDVNLDHLVGTATAIPAVVAGTYLDQMLDDGTAVYDRTTDSLQALRDRGDAVWITATGFSTHTAADVWTAATRVLTASTNLNDPTAAAIATAVWDELLSGHTAVSTFGKAIADIETDVTAILADTGTTLDAAIAAVKADTTAVLVDTADMQPKLGTPAGASISADIAAVPTAEENTSAALTTTMAESYAADGVAPTVTQALMMIQQMLGDFSIAGTTLMVKKVDGSTTAGIFTLDSATSPTSITRTT